jgi:hypothetical protein
MQNFEIEKPIESQQGSIRKGLYLKINGIKDLVVQGKMMILVGLSDDENLLKDDRGESCAFKTGVYEAERDAYNQANLLVEDAKLKVCD